MISRKVKVLLEFMEYYSRQETRWPTKESARVHGCCFDTKFMCMASGNNEKMTQRTKVNDEIEKYNVKIDISKRTGKAKELEPHSINLGHYYPSAKACGFTSDKVIDWIRAIEKYYDESEDLKCEWIKVTNQQNLYSEVQIQVQKLGVKCVTIHVFLTTGVILVKGNCWIQWAQYEFELFRKIVCGEDEEYSGQGYPCLSTKPRIPE